MVSTAVHRGYRPTHALKSGLRRPSQPTERKDTLREYGTYPTRYGAGNRKGLYCAVFRRWWIPRRGPFPPLQVQYLIDTNECQAWLRDPALFAIWGREPIASINELFTLAPEITEIASRLAHKHYQPLKANHYRAQHARHWQDEKGQIP
jgi:hypothetical protein